MGGRGVAKVPLLEYNEDLVIESEEVTKCIANNLEGDALVCSGAEEACLERFLQIWYPVVDTYYSVLTATSESSVRGSLQRFKVALSSLESVLQESKSDEFVLDSFSVAECIAAPWVQRFFVTLPFYRNIIADELLAERTERWMKAVRNRPSVMASKCPEDEMLAAAERYYVSYVTPGAPCRSLS